MGYPDMAMATARRSAQAALLALVCLVPQAAPADAPGWIRPDVEYVADMELESGEGVLRGRVWATRDKERREIRQGGRTHVVIVRRDRGVRWVLLPEQRMYVESRGDASLPQDRFRDGRLERQARGAERVNGVDTTRYLVTGTAADGEPFEAMMWMTGEEIPVRVLTTGEGGAVRLELRNLRVEPVPDARFEIPEGYRRFELPAAARQGLPGAAGRPGS